MNSKYKVPEGPANQEQQLVAVRSYALKKYGQDAWDMVVDVMSDDEIRTETRGCTTCWGAIERLRLRLQPLVEIRKSQVKQHEQA